jgi:hypothetical protein
MPLAVGAYNALKQLARATKVQSAAIEVYKAKSN